MANVIDVELDGDSLKILYSDGKLDTVPVKTLQASGDLVQALRFLSSAFRPLLQTNNSIPSTLRFGMATIVATADSALRKAGA